MFRCEQRIGVATQAASAEIRDALCSWRITMRIVAGRAGQLVSGCALAGALQQRFILTRCARAAHSLARVNEVKSRVTEVFSGFEGRQCSTGFVNDGVPFEMALQTGAVAACSVELVRIKDWTASTLREVQ